MAQHGPDAVTAVDEKTSSCFAPSYVETELELAEKQLQRPLDLVMLVNPEDYVVGRLNRLRPDESRLASAAASQPSDHVERWSRSMRSLLEDTFLMLNRRVQAGSLAGFGVSSEGLAISDALGMLQASTVAGAAANAAQRAGLPRLGGFSCVALPGNPVERRTWRGVAAWAKERDLGVLLTRPFTARDASGAPVPLDDFGAGASNAEVEAAVEGSYQAVLDHARDWFKVPDDSDTDWVNTYTEEERTGFAESSEFVLELLEQMHSQRDEYTSPLNWEKDLTTKILPLLTEKIERVDDTSDSVISTYLQQYANRVMWRCAAQTKRMLVSSIADGGLGYGSDLRQETPWPGVTLDPVNGSVRGFTGEWCRAVIDSGEAQGVILHAAAAEEALGLAGHLNPRA